MEELSLKPTAVDNCGAQDGLSDSSLVEDSFEIVQPIPSLVAPPPSSETSAMLVDPWQGNSSQGIPVRPMDEAL